MQSCIPIPKGPWLQTTCLTFLCCHSTASWNLRRLSAERGKIDLLAGFCGLTRLYWRVVCLRQLSLYSAGSCISLLLAKRQAGSDIFEAQCCRTDLLTFWDRGKLHFHAELHTQKPMTSDHMPDFSLLSFHSPLKLGLCGPKRLYWRVVCLWQLSL